MNSSSISTNQICSETARRADPVTPSNQMSLRVSERLVRITGPTPSNSAMSFPSNPESSKQNKSMKKRVAAGLASLYDDEHQGISAPIWENSTTYLQPEYSFDNSAVGRRLSTSSTYSQSDRAKGSNVTVGNGIYQGYNSTSQHSVFAIDNKAKIENVEDDREVPILSDWIGTSQFFADQAVAVQQDRQLGSLIDYRKAIVQDISKIPYDPAFYINLSRVDSKLGFCDIGAANAHRALLLVQAGLNIDRRKSRFDLGKEVRHSVARRLIADSPRIIIDELESLHVNAYHELLHGLLGSAAFWEGLLEANIALQNFPKHPDFLDIRRFLKEGFERRHNCIKDIVIEVSDILAFTRTGKIYQKVYPWLDETLYSRTPALIREVNKSFGAGNCEVKQVSFGIRTAQVTKTAENQDVGPLGVFATRDIEKGEALMVDKCITGISNVPSSRLLHCDACHASLRAPYIHPTRVIKPSCCGKVAFCSHACHDVASKGYHTVVCGKDIDWLYEHSQSSSSQRDDRVSWRPILFLRLICIVLSDRCSQHTAARKPTHPLQHPLIIRLAANYAPNHKRHPDICSDWQYFENVVAPHRILELLGVNIFSDPDFAPEVIQTIYWRIENNASMATVNLSPSGPGHKKSQSLDTRTGDLKDAVNMMCLNPNYIFFNHSCEPNVSWHGATPDRWVGISSLRGLNKEILRPGCSAVWCNASRDVKKGEELKISYVGDPMGDGKGERESKRTWMRKWFDGGCGCRICLSEDENEIKRGVD